MEVAMVTDGRVKELRRLLGMGRTLADSARMAEMSEQTGRKYRDGDGLPSKNKTVERIGLGLIPSKTSVAKFRSGSKQSRG